MRAFGPTISPIRLVRRSIAIARSISTAGCAMASGVSSISVSPAAGCGGALPSAPLLLAPPACPGGPKMGGSCPASGRAG
eukprot:2844481-Pleurochrysis_carterae.AAC.1